MLERHLLTEHNHPCKLINWFAFLLLLLSLLVDQRDTLFVFVYSAKLMAKYDIIDSVS